jgi:hypothetical protein
MERRADGGAKFAVFLLVAAVLAGLWQFVRRPATSEAVAQAAEPVVPTARQSDRRLDAVEQARQVRDAVNARTKGESIPG